MSSSEIPEGDTLIKQVFLLTMGGVVLFCAAAIIFVL